MGQSEWSDNTIQFPRLIAEINATQSLSIRALCESMDLTRDEVDELIDRADAEWERVKRNTDANGYHGQSLAAVAEEAAEFLGGYKDARAREIGARLYAALRHEAVRQ